MKGNDFDPLQLRDSPAQAEIWLSAAGILDDARGRLNLVSIIDAGIKPDPLKLLLGQLQAALPDLSDPDRALNHFERFLRNLPDPTAWVAQCENDQALLAILLQMFSTSQHLSDVIIQEPAVLDSMRLWQGAPVSRAILTDEVSALLRAIDDDDLAVETINAFKRRQMVRIAYGDIIRGQPLATVTRQISYLADAICEAALARATAQLTQRFGWPNTRRSERCSCVVLALGKLGGLELNYSSDLDLVFLYAEDGQTDGDRKIPNDEFFSRLSRRLVQLLTKTTSRGIAYRVDLRLRPEGTQGPPVVSCAAALRYYDVTGRTWERQAFVKARPIAGDLELGRRFLDELEPWIYRRLLSRADISGIKALKRRIELQAKRDGDDRLNVKTGHGGIRDIEFVIQFLQLLLGAEFPQVRGGNTLEAIAELEQVGGLSRQERTLLEQNYEFLRTIEHRLQIMFDTQTHRMPAGEDEQRKLALRLGYQDADQPALVQFHRDLEAKTDLNRRILDHLLHNTVGSSDESEPEIELVFDPNPDHETIDRVLGQHRFADTDAAYRNLLDLANERLPFLSKRRCRHFLATIAPKLLAEIARTPDPDATLVTLCRVSDSLGGKGALWELFNNSAASMNLYVRLCAACPYLSGILTSNPGMLDELMDSLLLERLPEIAALDETLEALCGGARDIEPILISFKNTYHLRVGVRDVLGKERIQNTTATLSDIAEVCVRRVVRHQLADLTARYGVPIRGDNSAECELVVLAVGKMGGREPNYHSDLDVIFLFESEGITRAVEDALSTSNQHFFGELGQRIIQATNRTGPYGQLYALDARLRPSGRSGVLAVSFDEFRKYFETGSGQLWERLALCKARPITGSPAARAVATRVVQHVLTAGAWSPSDAAAVHDMRMQMQRTATTSNLKRGPGGTVDIEFIVQMLQLRHGAAYPDILVPGTWQALDALHARQLISSEDQEFLTQSYTFLRNVEARLRLMNTTARHDFPNDVNELRKLAFLLDADTESLLRECNEFTTENRKIFLRLVDEAKR